jgi:hypothetical protein
VTERMLRDVFGVAVCGDIARRRAAMVATLRKVAFRVHSETMRDAL